MKESVLFLIQRVTAMMLALMVSVHLGMVIYAVRGGLSAAEILMRTQGNMAWALFYSIFVLTVTVHATIGLKNVAEEWTPLGTHSSLAIGLCFGLVSIILGARAVYSVYAL